MFSEGGAGCVCETGCGHFNMKVSWTPSQYKDGLSRYGVSIIKIRRSWDRLIFIMGIPILVRPSLYWGGPLVSLWGFSVRMKNGVKTAYIFQSWSKKILMKITIALSSPLTDYALTGDLVAHCDVIDLGFWLNQVMIGCLWIPSHYSNLSSWMPSGNALNRGIVLQWQY